MEWIQQNIQWLFSGFGCVVITTIVAIVRSNRKKSAANSEMRKVLISDSESEGFSSTSSKTSLSIDSLKARVSILFIDDERFNMVDILRNAGWRNTQYKKDVKSLQDPSILSAHIIFVDIYGVGLSLFKEQGLGLANALKDKYPEKVIIICSGENQGNIFNKTLRKVDECISKSAEPYEYISMVEEFAQNLVL